MTQSHETYYAMKAADDAFQAALVAQHGAKLAGDYRYQKVRDNAATRAAREAYHAAQREKFGVIEVVS